MSGCSASRAEGAPAGRATTRDGRSPLRPAAGVDDGGPCVDPITLLDLKSSSCRWPVNDGAPFLFCGALARQDGPYCPEHAALAVGQGTASEREAARTLRRQAAYETPIVSVE